MITATEGKLTLLQKVQARIQAQRVPVVRQASVAASAAPLVPVSAAELRARVQRNLAEAKKQTAAPATPPLPSPGPPSSVLTKSSQGIGGSMRLPSEPRPLVTKPASPHFSPTVSKPKSKGKDKSTPEQLQERTLKALNLSSPLHALLCAPSSFMDCRRTLRRVGRLEEDVPVMLLLQKTGEIKGYDARNTEVSAAPHASLYDAPWPTHWKHITRVRIELTDEEGTLLYMSAFGGGGVRGEDAHGKVLVHATIKQMGSKLFLNNVERIAPEAFGRVYPRYTTPGSTTSEAGVRMIVNTALEQPDAIHACVNEIVRKTLLSETQMLQIATAAMEKAQRDFIPSHAPAGHQADLHLEPTAVKPFGSMSELIMAMHCPQTPEQGSLAVAAARAIAIEGVCHVARRTNERAPHPKSPINLTPSVIDRVIHSQSETLTPDQQIAVKSICRSLQRPTPLTGLLSGDVGTGKTLTFAIPCVAAHLCGAKVAILSPTEILANQVHQNLVRRFPLARIERVLTGKKITDPSAILVGTAGLATVAAKHGYEPDLVVVDEQHKLSTEIRSALCKPWTHLIEASATPIPRSLAASLFAGMEVFNLKSAPVRRDIQSFLIDESQRGEVIRTLRQTLEQGARAAFIYPRVQMTSPNQRPVDGVPAAEAPPSSNTSVLQAAEILEQRFPGKVGILHGKMKSEDIASTLERFRDATCPIVVSSTVMETGIDVPDIRLLVVRDADNFGAAQLHQLRGRLARNGGCAAFFMLVNNLSTIAPETLERLQVVANTMDGYALAEADMRQRGIGDLTGEAQSGNVISPIRLLGLSIDDFEG